MIYYVEDDDNIRGLTLYALRQQGIEAEGFSCDSEFKAAVARRVTASRSCAGSGRAPRRRPCPS